MAYVLSKDKVTVLIIDKAYEGFKSFCMCYIHT